MVYVKRLLLDEDCALEHHGILKQKWGVRHGPPYPLKYDDHSKDQKKANPKSSLNNYDDASSSKSRIVSGSKIDTRSYPHNLSEEKLANKIKDDARKDRAKKILIATTATAGIAVACYLTYKYGAVDRIAENLNKAAETGVKVDEQKIVEQACKQSLQDMDTVLKQGDVLHRMHPTKDFDLDRTIGKGTYVTMTEADRAAYMRYLKDWHRTGERYDISMELKKDIKIPNEKKARELFEQYWDGNQEYQKELYNTLVSAYTKLGTTKGLAEVYAAKEIKSDKFKAGIYGIVKSGKDQKMLFEMYQKAGYSAIIDYFDKGTLGESPLILFNAKSDVIVTGSKFVTETMKEDARQLLADQSQKSHPMHGYAKLGL